MLDVEPNELHCYPFALGVNICTPEVKTWKYYEGLGCAPEGLVFGFLLFLFVTASLNSVVHRLICSFTSCAVITLRGGVDAL